MVETLLLLPVVIEVLFWAIVSNLVLDALVQQKGKMVAGCCTLNKSWLSVSITHGVMGQSTVCACDFSWPYSLVESIYLLAIQLASSI